MSAISRRVGQPTTEPPWRAWPCPLEMPPRSARSSPEQQGVLLGVAQPNHGQIQITNEARRAGAGRKWLSHMAMIFTAVTASAEA